jgi:hypothetical protein
MELTRLEEPLSILANVRISDVGYEQGHRRVWGRAIFGEDQPNRLAVSLLVAEHRETEICTQMA